MQTTNSPPGGIVPAMARPNPSWARNLLGFALANKAYWVVPLVLVSLLLVGVLATSSTAAAPFIYSVH
jgi:hypothetical protein